MNHSPVRIVAVGDLQLGDSPTCVGFGFASRYRPDSLARVFDDIAPALTGADLVFGNLETPLSMQGARADSLRSRQLRGVPGYAPVMRESGFTVLNVANNHAVQHGVPAFEESVEAVRRTGIAVCGVRGTPPWASHPVRITTDGRRLGVLGYCLRPRQYSDATPPYAEGPHDAILADVTRLRGECDAVIVSLHWGEEFVAAPSADETRFGRSLIDAGASLVLGHHPHVVRPVEAYKHGLIAYSLGNFAGDMVWYAPFRTGLVLTATLDGAVVRDAIIEETLLGADYRPRLPGIRRPVRTAPDIPELGASDYAREIRRTWRRQRVAAYCYTFSRPWRFPPRILAQLVVQTLRNKLAGLARTSSPSAGA